MRKIVNRRTRRQGPAGTVAADISAVVAGNTGGSGRTAAGSRRQVLRIVQRRGRTTVSESSDTATSADSTRD